jgi:hypothetical protein
MLKRQLKMLDLSELWKRVKESSARQRKSA